jgi:hypothetical protein
MKLKLLILLTIVAFSCKNNDKVSKDDSITGIWLLVDLNIREGFWRDKNQVPLGFRFYSSDSAEVYRNNYEIKRNRFTKYQKAKDSIFIFQSDSLGWWKQRMSSKGDTLRVYLPTDTIIYQRLHVEASSKPKFKKIILAEGSSWGNFVSAVIYPDGKTLIYIRDAGDKILKEFYIRSTLGLFNQIVESIRWINPIFKHETYHDVFRQNFEGDVVMDGAYSEILMLGADSSWFSHEGQMSTFQKHFLGLQGYAFSKILKEDMARDQYRKALAPIACDSIRIIPYPICKLKGITNHLTISTLIMESLNSSHRIDNFHGDLNFNFENACSPNSETIHTNGRIISHSSHFYNYYDVGYDFFEILKKH